ncbi:hypothetical protein [Amycolatopsis sp. Hca4]|uniref:hypothetical protein n=1 Tax=Amycolatopsis sp. Hca4 TaxID=2742131 RepID=UPI0015913A61|nr:hypothetical protein [Amycolatopsis sp. Hca4]QKV73345.1 hypothetical protein HUT10_05765 [Amycolatopsis sp. Hca4]
MKVRSTCQNAWVGGSGTGRSLPFRRGWVRGVGLAHRAHRRAVAEHDALADVHADAAQVERQHQLPHRQSKGSAMSYSVLA